MDEEAYKKRIKDLEDALELCMIGGNHIASALIGRGVSPSEYTNFSYALERLAVVTDQRIPPDFTNYEMWCCWKCIMTARMAHPDYISGKI